MSARVGSQSQQALSAEQGSRGDPDEMCPICRSSRYLNPDMRLLVNSECYHKMCSACVDRLFSVGPAPCPYRGCGHTLRKARFKEQVFESLDVEREVDVRQRLCRIYNRRAETFASEREYDDYLEHLEELIYAIADGSPEEKRAAEQEVSQYETTHKQEILQTALSRKQEAVTAEEMQRHEAERQVRLRQLAIALQQAEAAVRAESQQELLEDLAKGSRTPDEVVKQIQRRVEARTAELRREYESELARSAAHSQAARAASTAARRRVVQAAAQATSGPVPATPFTPFNGDRNSHDMFHQLSEYFDPWMKQAADPVVKAGGFNVYAAQQEVLTLAFMGLGIDIEREKSVLAAG